MFLPCYKNRNLEMRAAVSAWLVFGEESAKPYMRISKQFKYMTDTQDEYLKFMDNVEQQLLEEATGEGVAVLELEIWGEYRNKENRVQKIEDLKFRFPPIDSVIRGQVGNLKNEAFVQFKFDTQAEKQKSAFKYK